MPSLQEFLAAIGEEIHDAEEESFLLFSRDIPSANLGFVDARTATVDLTIHGQDFSIHQSPTLLSSARAGGTTGAVLWKITPRFAEWISPRNQKNPFWSSSILTSSSTVVELGCGISALVALSLGPSVGHFIATDQEYVHRLFRENLESNAAAACQLSHQHNNRHGAPRQQKKLHSQSAGGKSRAGSKRSANSSSNTTSGLKNVTFTTLDWELDVPCTLKDTIDQNHHQSTGPEDSDDEGKDPGFDLLISCDCIYNEALIPPFVHTCADICRLRPPYDPTLSLEEMPPRHRPTICVIAQQQRSPDVFDTWLRETIKEFHVWRLSDDVLGEGLKAGTGYVVHALVLRKK
ncbi:hypothetical protein VTN77DRAFT_3549 [Rasamsonia byssochlamydoides]|uniref:uncharacterized protein n=1 Tax=Rasamsonia byssochlamydoides TaxID=89139 RepID=UPI003744A366